MSISDKSLTIAPRLILEVSMPRCGTSNIRRLLRGFDHVETYSEVFHPNQSWVTKATARSVFGSEYSAQDLHRRLRTDPIWGLEQILDHAAAKGKSYAEFKLFPRHLRTAQIEQVVTHFHPIGFVMHRAPVDIYISLKKQTVSGAWAAVPTSHIIPELDAKEFLRWRWRQQYHLQMCRRILERQGLPIVILSYEDLYGSDAAPETILSEAFRSVGVSFGAFNPEAERLPRQDTTSDRSRKVLNWAEFSEAVTSSKGHAVLERFDVIGRRPIIDALRALEKTAPRSLIHKAARILKISSVKVQKPARIDNTGSPPD